MNGDRQKRLREIMEQLRRQYRVMKYGQLHRALLKEGIETDLCIGRGIEMRYPDVYDPLFTLHVFDDENLVILDKRESSDDPVLQRTLKIAGFLGYRVKGVHELTEEERELYFC